MQETRMNTTVLCPVHRQAAQGMAALQTSYEDCVGLPYAEHKAFTGKKDAERKRPVRGDNRTGQAIWALGVDGRSRRIQPMGRDNRSHIH